MLLLLRLQRQRVGGKDLKGWRRASKDVLPSCIEPRSSPQPVFVYLRLLFTKRTQWVCGGSRRLAYSFQQCIVTGLKARKEDHIHPIANGLASFRPGETCHTPPLSANLLVVDL